MDDTVSAGPDVFSAYKIAMKFEEDGAKMYEEAAKKTADTNAKMIYQFMNIQENEHYRLLAESLNYLENPQQWFLEAEKPHFEG
jgi:rubrerythrin